MAILEKLQGIMKLREAWRKIERNEEAINEEVNEVKQSLEAQENRIDNIVSQSGDDITEIVDARQPASGPAYPSLKARLDAKEPPWTWADLE